MHKKDEVTTQELGLEAAQSKMSSIDDGALFEHIELKPDRFSTWSVIGINFSITAAPVAILLYTNLVTGAGGTSYYFWCYIVTIFGQLFVCASLAEIAAFIPHASGKSQRLSFLYFC